MGNFRGNILNHIFDFVFVNGYTNTKEENLEYNHIGKVKDFSGLV